MKRTLRSIHITTTAPSARTWRNAVFGIFALNGIIMASWVARIPAVRDILHVDPAQVGLLLVGGSVGAIAGLLASSHVVAALGGRRTILVTLLAEILGLAVIGVGATITGQFAVVWIGLAILGGGTAICDVAMNVEGASVERRIGRTIMPLFHASWSIGTVVGAGVGSAMVFLGVPVALHLGAVGVVALVAAPILVRSVPPHPVDADGDRTAPTTLRERLSIWREPRTLLIGVIVLGLAFTEGAASDWLALAMIDDRHVDTGQGALLFAVFTASMTLGRIVAGPVVDRLGRVIVLRCAAALAIVGLLGVILVPSVPVDVVGIVLWGVGASIGFPLGMSAAADDPNTAVARVSAVTTVGYFAFLVGPPVIGFLGNRFGLLNALLLVVVLTALSLAATPAARESGARASA